MPGVDVLPPMVCMSCDVLDVGPRRTYSTWYGPAELRKKTMSPSRAFAYEVCVNIGERRIH